MLGMVRGMVGKSNHESKEGGEENVQIQEGPEHLRVHHYLYRDCGSGPLCRQHLYPGQDAEYLKPCQRSGGKGGKTY